MPHMDWDDIRVFAAVARAGGLAAGALAAGVDRSTASRRIQSLERALSVRLFLRTRDGLRASPAAARLLQHAEQMEQAAQAMHSVGSETTRVHGRVRIATTEALATMLVRAGLLELSARHPELEVELLGSNRVLDLARGEADLALRVSAVKEPSLRVRKVAGLGFAAYAAAAYVQQRGRPGSERQLAGHSVLLPSAELAQLPEAKWLASQPDVHVALRTNSIPALLAALSAGTGVAVIASGLARSTRGLVRLFEIAALKPRPLWIALHPDAAARSAVRVTADHIAAILTRAPRPLQEIERR
jgi:DNA-binding transcriptional LysR family regulator